MKSWTVKGATKYLGGKDKKESEQIRTSEFDPNHWWNAAEMHTYEDYKEPYKAEPDTRGMVCQKGKGWNWGF